MRRIAAIRRLAAALVLCLAWLPVAGTAQEQSAPAEAATEGVEALGEALTGPDPSDELSDIAPPDDALDVDFSAWSDTAERIERTLADGEPPTGLLERIRGDLVGYRDRFSILQNQQNARIQTLEAQLNALGPAPEEGEEEAQDVADRRAALNAQPRRRARLS